MVDHRRSQYADAAFLAQIDQQLRSMRSNSWKTKKDKGQCTRSFGVVSVILLGDFWQLEPPSGTPLAQIPTEYVAKARRFDPSANTARGQSLLWGTRQHVGSVQGVTELTEHVRCQDAWFEDVQQQFRNGALTEETHAFMHGQPTNVPGSWSRGRSTCKNPACEQLQGKTPARLHKRNALNAKQSVVLESWSH